MYITLTLYCLLTYTTLISTPAYWRTQYNMADLSMSITRVCQKAIVIPTDSDKNGCIMTTFYCQYIKNKPKIRMGNFISIIITRLLDYPLKITRPCAYLPDVPDPEQKISTFQVHADTDADKKIKSNYDKLVDQFNEKLLKNRMENRTRDGKSWEERNLLINFPDWSESTISYLHSLFLTFYNEKKMIDFKAFSCILLCLWSGNDKEKRRNQFKKSDINQDGFIDYLEFLDLIYSDKNLAAVSKKIAEQTQFINGLSIGEQLEYGLF